MQTLPIHHSQSLIDLKQELLDMCKTDQKARMYRIDHPESQDWKKVAHIDQIHGVRLKEIVDKYSWPGISMVGTEGSSAMWLLTQHQDNDIEFQKKCLDLLSKAVDQEEVEEKHYAYLLDRVNMHQGLPQVYGTQWIQEDGKWHLYTVDDKENLDNYRLKAGLSPIAEYKEAIKQAYQLSDKDFLE